MPRFNRNPCPECGDRLELDDRVSYSKVWQCTGLIDPDNPQAELQPCMYERDYRKSQATQEATNAK